MRDMGEAKIDRTTWIKLFERGFERGATGQEMQPEFPHEKMGPEDVAESEAELAALEAGYEEGGKNRVPGASVNIEEMANTAYDRSEYSAGLDRWS